MVRTDEGFPLPTGPNDDDVIVDTSDCATGAVDPEVIAAQRAWSEGIIELGRIVASGHDAHDAAVTFVQDCYAHELGPVLFKPTRARDVPFRPSVDDAVSYFVGGDPRHAEDAGFASQGWVRIVWHIAGVVSDGDRRIVMGTYEFVDRDHQEVGAEFTIGYRPGPDGTLRMDVHHSSIPFHPDV